MRFMLGTISWRSCARFAPDHSTGLIKKASYRLRSDNLCIAGFDCRARLLRCFAIALP
jgi:hypothetical protein